jgi:ATP-dependent RNA helicase RhlB
LVTKLFNRVKEKIKKIVFTDAVTPPSTGKVSEAPPSVESLPELSAFREKKGRKPKKNLEEKPWIAPQPESKSPPTEWDDTLFRVEPAEGKTRFHDLDLPLEVMHAIYETGFSYCTPIQAMALPDTLTGKDLAGRAQTGTGKTAAFLITILTHLLRTSAPAKRRHGTPRALVLAPTRELVLQIVDDAELLSKYCSINIVALLGGMAYQKQQQQLSEQTVDIVVATPGRLLDFKRQQYLHLEKVEILVIDEADRMLDMGFIPDVRQIVYSTPEKDKRQTLLFSATLTKEVTHLASQWTNNPVIVEIESEQVVTDSIDQKVFLVTRQEKFALLYNIISRQRLERVIIFCNRKDETRALTEKLRSYGMNCAILSGDVPQQKRMKTLEDFRNGKIEILVATDVAGRGIHIEGVSHVINFTLPHDPEDYVHRIGRTGRSGAWGISVSFADERDSFQLPDIEEFIGAKLTCTHPEPEWLTLPPLPPGKGGKKEAAQPRKKRRPLPPGDKRRGRPDRTRS